MEHHDSFCTSQPRSLSSFRINQTLPPIILTPIRLPESQVVSRLNKRSLLSEDEDRRTSTGEKSSESLVESTKRRKKTARGKLVEHQTSNAFTTPRMNYNRFEIPPYYTTPPAPPSYNPSGGCYDPTFYTSPPPPPPQYPNYSSNEYVMVYPNPNSLYHTTNNSESKYNHARMIENAIAYPPSTRPVQPRQNQLELSSISISPSPPSIIQPFPSIDYNLINLLPLKNLNEKGQVISSGMDTVDEQSFCKKEVLRLPSLRHWFIDPM